MATRYTVNGQEMSEEEFQKFQNEYGFYNFGNRRQQKRWDHKPHLYQSYKDVAPNRWKEISIDEFKADIGKEPKYKKEFSYVQSINNEYIINTVPVVAIFYNHIDGNFHYMKSDGIISENNCFSSEKDAKAAILKLENKKCGEHKLFSASGELIKIFMPDFNDDSLSENIAVD